MNNYKLAKDAMKSQEYDNAEKLFLTTIYEASINKNILVDDLSRSQIIHSLKYLAQNIYPLISNRKESINKFYEVWSNKSPDVALGYVYFLGGENNFQEALKQLHKIKNVYFDEFVFILATLIMQDGIPGTRHIEAAFLYKYCQEWGNRSEQAIKRLKLVLEKLNDLERNEVKLIDSDNLKVRVDNTINNIYSEPHLCAELNKEGFYIKNIKEELLDLVGFKSDEEE